MEKDFNENKSFLKRVHELKSSSGWREIDQLCSSYEGHLEASVAYIWVQSLIKAGRFIKAADILKSRFGELDKKTIQYIKIKFDLMFSRRNFPEAAKVARRLIEMQPKDPDPQLRLIKSLLSLGEISEAAEVARRVEKVWGDNQSVHAVIEGVKRREAEDIANKRRIKNIARKLELDDVFDVEPPSGVGCSVVVPCFNVEKFIERTVDSIIDCNHKEIEIILVDDCSTDNTLRTLKRYQSEYPDLIKVIQHKSNSGASAARNSGLLAANLPYVTFLDSDDLMVKGGVSRRVECLRTARASNDRVIGSYGASITISEDAIAPPVSTLAKGMRIVDYLTSDGLCPFNANQPLFVTEFLRLSGGFPESERTAEDWPFWLLLLRMGARIVPTHALDVTYRMRANSLIRGTATAHLKNSYAILKSIDDKAELFFSKPYREYEIQKKFIDRFFNFWGMKIGESTERNKDSSRVSKELSSEYIDAIGAFLPDLSLINPGVKYFKSRILQGVSRYYCVPAADQLKDAQLMDDIARGFALGADSLAQGDLIARRRSGYKKIRKTIDVVFLPHKEYHARSAELIGKELQKLGVSYHIVDFSSQYGDEGVSRYLANSDSPSLTINKLSLGLYAISAVVVFNDWDFTARSIIDLFKAQGAKAIGIVEGVNDYYSVDTGVWRPAYRYVESLLVPGVFHEKYFDGHSSMYATGVQRLDPLISKMSSVKPTSARNLKCVINCNFTYGVLVEHRIFFLKTICDVLLELKIEPIISRHPQDVGDIGEYEKYVSACSMYELLEEARVFITRFSGSVYEALLAGVHVVYFNPGIERWDMFFDPLGAYAYIETPQELGFAVKKLVDCEFDISRAKDFLDKHCDVQPGGVSSSAKTAAAISEILKNQKEERFPGLDLAVRKDASPFFEGMREVRAFIDKGNFELASGLLEVLAKSQLNRSEGKSAILSNERKRILRLKSGEVELLGGAITGPKKSCNNLFLIFSCEKYIDRVKLLREYYQKSLSESDCFIFVIGGAERSYVDRDVLRLECGDAYEKLPEKVFKAIGYVSANFDFERIVKIDDDIFVNYRNFYKILGASFNADYYGRRNPPNFGYPLNKRWHYGKVSKGHKYDNFEFPLIEPAQWCSGGCYIISRKAAHAISAFSGSGYVSDHVFEDYMIFDILSKSDIYPSFHENSRWQGLTWMEVTLDRVMDSTFCNLNDSFDLDSVATIHCGPTNKYKVESDDLKRIFRLLDKGLFVRGR